MKNAFIIGLVLLVISAYSLYLMAVELWISTYAYERYEVRRSQDNDYKRADFYGHKVILSENIPLGAAQVPKNGNFYIKAAVKTSIDGKDYSLPELTEVQVINDYTYGSGSVALINLKDRQLNEERLAIIQRVDGEHYPDDIRYRILFLQPDGSVSEEWFKYSERDEPAYRTMLAIFVHPEPLGFRSQVMGFWPSIFYPIIYPLLTGLVGVVLTVIGGVGLLKRRSEKVRILH